VPKKPVAPVRNKIGFIKDPVVNSLKESILPLSIAVGAIYASIYFPRLCVLR
jgi:hypothetical protein